MTTDHKACSSRRPAAGPAGLLILNTRASPMSPGNAFAGFKTDAWQDILQGLPPTDFSGALMEDWQKDAAGNIVMAPLVRYQTATATNNAVGVRLEFPLPGDRLASPSGNLQLMLTPEQAVHFARSLMAAAGSTDLNNRHSLF